MVSEAGDLKSPYLKQRSYLCGPKFSGGFSLRFYWVLELRDAGLGFGEGDLRVFIWGILIRLGL